MRTIKIQQGQSVFDIAIQELGSVLGAVEVALLNDISITETLMPGQDIKVPDKVIEMAIVADLMKNRIRPATAETKPNASTLQHLFENGLFENGLFE